MPILRDHHLPLAPDWECKATIDDNSIIQLADPTIAALSMGDVRPNTWMLEVRYRATSRWKLPAVTISDRSKSQATELFTQYFEPNETGKRLINLTGIESLHQLQLTLKHLTLEADATLLGFRNPDLASGPILIIAPHPDDAELAAFGVYSQHPKNTWIVTITAGERLKRLDKQYWPGLDDSLEEASQRKGSIRAWNSATTPLLAGVPADQLVMLGYFNDTMSALHEKPDTVVPSYSAPATTPDTYRQWNKLSLPTDGQAQNTGENLQSDLASLLNKIKPTTIITPHPGIDPHADHIASTRHLQAAIEQSGHSPKHLLLYANHLKSTRGFPRGPAHAAAGVWPTQASTPSPRDDKIASYPLSIEAQKQKTLALHSMHDLGGTPGLERQLKRKLKRLLSGTPSSDWSDYSGHDFFQTHIKAHENFVLQHIQQSKKS
ncbi:PIG-L family deacetylase [Halomonas sp.]|uniref:PIG-L deacetylase family protein n=1 Tax=Halomonas sp. TaxID=1486246 RepID=UPI00257C4945|nr:PIG-L family deacetylase [Halomonas sp.]MCJ8287996.1 PIG-L family deacetylase [Halomonas sp.]NQY73034.1 PIG-L family deacetylase [Halomonas sp.]